MADPQSTRYFTPLEPTELPPVQETSLPAEQDQQVDVRDLALKAPRNRWLKPALWGVSAALLAIGGYEAIQVVSALDRIHPLLGILGAAMFAAVAGLAGAALWRARGVAADQRSLQALREQAAVLRDSRQSGGFQKLAGDLREFYNEKPQLPQLETALSGVGDSWEDGEALTHFEQQFLEPLDRQAQTRIRQVAVQSGSLVALSPWVLMDMVVVLWRLINLLDEVGRIYGVRGSTLGRWLLLKRVLATMAAAGASELVVDQLVERSSNKLLAGLSGAAAQGVGCGLYTARLGWIARQVTRPVPASVKEQGRLGELYQLLRQQLINRVKGGSEPENP